MTLKERIKYYSQPQPLTHSPDYESYWQKRQGGDRDYLKWSRGHRKIILSEILEDGSSLLDVGCGNCSLFDLLSTKKPDMRLCGIESSETAAEIGRKKGYNVIVGDLTKASLKEEYDYITILNVLEHIYHAEEMVMNIRNMFRRRLYVSVPNLGYFGFRIKLGIFGRMPNTGCFYHIREHIRFWTYADFIYWAEQHGFEVTKVWGNVDGKIRGKYPSLFSTNILYELKRK